MMEQDFLREIAAHPYDIGPRLVYADWLEERGDPRADAVRAVCQYRQPVSAGETRHLRAIANSRNQANASQVTVDVQSANPGYPLVRAPSGLPTLIEDLRHLSPVEIARNFPRDGMGRLQLDCTVLLAEYECGEHLPRGRQVWLVAAGPKRRSDPQLITVRLELLIGENQPHNWSRIRWWWDDRRQAVGEEERWGITGAGLRQVTGEKSGRHVAELLKQWRSGTLTRLEGIALCTAMQDQGRFEEALKVCEIEFPEDISRLLNGEVFKLPGGCDHVDTKAAAARAQRLRKELWESAPWRFADALSAVQARLDAWRAEKAGRPRKAPELRLFIFPRAPHARKPGLSLVAGQNGPRLMILFTGSNVVLPESEWKRPVELDIARCCGNGAEAASYR